MTTQQILKADDMEEVYTVQRTLDIPDLNAHMYNLYDVIYSHCRIADNMLLPGISTIRSELKKRLLYDR